MDDLNDFRDIWHSAGAGALPGTGEIRRFIRRYRLRRMVTKSWMLVFCFLLLGGLVFEAVWYRPVLPSTLIGELCMGVPVLFLVINNARSLGRAWRAREYNNKAFLEYLLEGHKGRLRYYRREQAILFTLASAGWLLFLYEFLRETPTTLLMGYGAAAVELAVFWLGLRPRVKRRYLKRYQKTLDEYNALQGI